MVNPFVARATSDLLIGPDWAMNADICDLCNRDPAVAKDIARGIKKRLRRRKPKVQLLALTLLETLVKNCGDIFHMHVAEKQIPHQMVKIVKRKPDFGVKEKILVLIDTWQEAFGGPRARYPQYFVAYQELLRLGAVFPERSDTSAPVLIRPQTQNIGYSNSKDDAAESSAEPEFPTLSLEEIQNARGVLDILAEMLSTLDPDNKEGLKHDVLVDLVEQCRTYKQRVVHLINSTIDESLLSQGLKLNDDLQRVLAMHESMASRVTEKPKAVPDQVLVDVDVPLIDTGDAESGKGSMSATSLGTQLLVLAPSETAGQVIAPTSAHSKVDLLSGDDFNSPTANSSLALVPIGDLHQPTSPVASQQNALAIVDTFQPNNESQSSNSIGQGYHSSLHFHQQMNFQSPSPVLPPYCEEQSLFVQGQGSTAWDGHMAQPTAPVPGAQENSVLPPPPWEAQLDESASATINNESEQTMGNVGGMYPQHIYTNQVVGYGYGYGYSNSYDYGTMEQGMYGLSLRDNNGTSRNSYVPSGKPSKPQDKLFGDLVDITKFKPTKNTPG